MLLKSRESPTWFRACFLPGRATDLFYVCFLVLLCFTFYFVCSVFLYCVVYRFSPGINLFSVYDFNDHSGNPTYLLTYSMVQSPSWEANWFAASQEIPRILWNPKVHYRTHKRPPPVPILGQPYPVHIPTSHLLEIHPKIIHPSMPRSPQWSVMSVPPSQFFFPP